MQPPRRLSVRALAGLASWALPLIVVFLVSPQLLHAAGPGRFGVLMIALVTPLIACQLELGISSAAVRRLAARFVTGRVDAGTTLFTLAIALSLIGILFGAAMWLAAEPISAGLGFAETLDAAQGPDLVRACAVWVALSLITLLPGILARAAQALVLTAVVQTTVSVILWVGALLLVRQGAPLVHVIWLGLVLGTTAAATTMFALRGLVDWKGPLRFDAAMLFSDARFSAGMFAAQAASTLVYQGDRMLISALGSPAMAGLYALCANVANKSVAAIAALCSFVLPHAAGLQATGERAGMIGLVHALDRTIAILLIPMLVPGLLLAGPFLGLWLGKFGTPELAAAFRILLIAFACPAFAMPVSNVLVASGNSGLSARFAWLTVLIVLGSMTWLVPGYGLIGAVGAMLLGNAMVLPFALIARRLLRIPAALNRGRFWLGLVLGCAAQLALLAWLGPGALSWLSLLATAAAAWSAFYLVRAIVAALSPEEVQFVQRLTAALRR